jgi:hypothetical protein
MDSPIFGPPISRHRTATFLILPLFTVVIATGCGESLGTVSGTVTFEGKPLPTGRVVFHPEDTSSAPAFARLNTDGLYRLARAKGVQGVTPGKYRVSIQSALKESDPQFLTFTREYPIPENYANEEATPLSAEVVVGNNIFDFEVPKRAPTRK